MYSIFVRYYSNFIFQCPVFDLLETVQYDGLRQTVSKTGGIIISVCLYFILTIYFLSTVRTNLGISRVTDYLVKKIKYVTQDKQMKDLR